jgi:hypothetical protein
MLIHYTVVRKDLPVGVMSAQIVHAAGESGALLGRPFEAIAVVLEVANEAELDKVVIHLLDYSIPHIRIREGDGPYSGQFMAIGLVPQEREVLSPIMAAFQLLKGDPGDECTCSNCRLDKPTEVR